MGHDDLGVLGIGLLQLSEVVKVLQRSVSASIISRSMWISEKTAERRSFLLVQPIAISAHERTFAEIGLIRGDDGSS